MIQLAQDGLYCVLRSGHRLTGRGAWTPASSISAGRICPTQKVTSPLTGVTRAGLGARKWAQDYPLHYSSLLARARISQWHSIRLQLRVVWATQFHSDSTPTVGLTATASCSAGSNMRAFKRARVRPDGMRRRTQGELRKRAKAKAARAAN